MGFHDAVYGTPGYSGIPVTPSMPPAPSMPSAPMTPSMPSGPPVAMGTTPGSMGAAPMAEQPPRPLVLMVKDEAGNPRKAAVSPTRHAPGSKLPGAYLNEFGLGCIAHAGFFHRRLPDVFLPKGVWEDRAWRLPSSTEKEQSFWMSWLMIAFDWSCNSWDRNGI